MTILGKDFYSFTYICNYKIYIMYVHLKVV